MRALLPIALVVIGYLLYEKSRLSEELSYANAAKTKLQVEKDHAHDREVKLLEERGELNGQLLVLKVEYDKCSKTLEDLKNSSTEDKLKLTSLIPQLREDQFKVEGLKDNVIQQKEEITSLQERLNSNMAELMRLKDVNRACENRLATLEERLASSWLAGLWRFLGLL